jgi:hypothetical protein
VSGSRDRTASRDVAVCVVFVALLLAMLAWYAAVWQRGPNPWGGGGGPDDFRELMGRKRNRFAAFTSDGFRSGRFQEELETAAEDHVPFRSRWLPAYTGGRRLLGAAVLRVLPRPWVRVLPAGAHAALRDERRLYGLPLVYDPARNGGIAERARFYNELAERHPTVRVAVVPVIPVGDWLALSGDHFRGRSDVLAGRRYVDALRENLNSRVKSALAGEASGPAEMLRLYFRTDHHLTIRGIHAVYRQIHGLLLPAEGAPAPRCERWRRVPNVAFRGSLARRALWGSGPADVLEDGEFGLPPMEIFRQGSPFTRSRRAAYGTSAQPGGRYANHYARYFGYDYGMLHYCCPGGTASALVVLSDSYCNPMEPLLASHFRNTYFVDLRYYAESTGTEFDLDAFIGQHGISHVLFFGDQSWVLGLDGPGPGQG